MKRMRDEEEVLERVMLKDKKKHFDSYKNKRRKEKDKETYFDRNKE